MDHRPRRFTALALAFVLASPAAVCFATDRVGAFIPETSSVVLSLDNLTNGQRRSFHFGVTNAHSTTRYPFTGDFDGDGKDSLGQWVSRERLFYVADVNVPGPVAAMSVPPTFPPAPPPVGEYWPVVGDWDADGVDELGLFDNGSNTWYLDGLAPFVWGWPGVIAIPLGGNWDGLGGDSVGIFNPALNRFAFTQTVPPSGEPTSFVYGSGSEGDVHPVVGDWNGDGKDSAGYYVLGAETFHLRNDATGGDLTTVTLAEMLPEFAGFQGNVPETFPVAGDWDTLPALPPDVLYDWEFATPASQGLSQAVLNAAVAKGAGSNYSHLHSLLVARHGKLVLDAYFRGYGPYTTNNIKSCSKSVLSALYGIAIDQGSFPGANPANPLPSLLGISMRSWLPEYTFSAEIKLWHMVTMSAGLAWTENPFPAGFLPSNDWVGFVVSQPFNPSQLGNVWTYSSGLTHCGSEILTRATGLETKAFADQELFSAIGITATRWDHEPRSNVIPTNSGRELYLGGWQIYMRPRDLAGFGQLYLDGGIFDDGTGPEQVVPQVWIQQTTASAGVANHYGAWWRTETFCQSNPPFKCSAGFNALGYGGQHVFVFPSLDLLVAMTSTWNVTGSQSGTQVGKNQSLLRDVLNAVVGD